MDFLDFLVSVLTKLWQSLVVQRAKGRGPEKCDSPLVTSVADLAGASAPCTSRSLTVTRCSHGVKERAMSGQGMGWWGAGGAPLPQPCHRLGSQTIPTAG